MGSRRIWVALGIAVAAHGVVLWLWPAADRAVRLPLELTIELEAPLPPAPPLEPPLPETPAPESPAPETPDDPLDAVAEVPEPVPVMEIADAEVDALPPPPALNLTRPDVWPEAPPSEDVDAMVYAFRPELYQGLLERREEQARATVLDERRIAVAGLTPEEYNAQGIRPTVVKTEKGCFEQRMDLDGRVIGEQRWWRVSCNEILENPFLLPALEYDALGRAVGLSDL